MELRAKKQKNNKWKAYIDIKNPYTDRRIKTSVSGSSTRREALERGRDKIDQLKKTMHINTEIRFNEAFKLYIERDNIRQSTKYVYESKGKKHIVPFMNNMKVSDIDENTVLDFRDYLSEKESLSNTSKRNLFNIFKGMMKYFYNNDFIVKNPTTSIKNFLPEGKEMDYWDSDEMLKFLSVVDDTVLYTFYWTLLFTGVRRGECLAITISDIDFNNKSLTINKSLSYTKDGYILGDPKTNNSIRVLSLDNRTIKVLRDYLEYLEKSSYIKDDFIFSINGEMLCRNKIRRNVKKYATIAGVKVIRIHDFRHSHASFLINNGATEFEVSYRLGHSSYEFTLDTYCHVYNDNIKKMNDDIYNYNLKHGIKPKLPITN